MRYAIQTTRPLKIRTAAKMAMIATMLATASASLLISNVTSFMYGNHSLLESI